MSSPASLAKHPLHPILVSLPIGLWVFSCVSDFIHIMGWGGVIWSEVAFYTLAGGMVGAFLAAIPGLIDYTSLTNPLVKRRATMHMALMVTAMALFAVSLWVRAQYGLNDGLAQIFSGIGLVVLGVAGWFGGELVYVHGVAVEPQHEAARKAGGKQSRKLRLV
jgi:uncharacterized membrane protein